MKRTAPKRDVGIVFLGYSAFFLGRSYFFYRDDCSLLIPVGLMAVAGSVFLGVGLWNKSNEDT